MVREREYGLDLGDPGATERQTDSTAPKPRRLYGSIHPCNDGRMATMKRCTNRVPEALSGPLSPDQRARCGRSYDPSLGPHGGKCEARKLAKNPDTGKVIGETKWQWYANRVPKPVEIHISPPHDGLGFVSSPVVTPKCACPDGSMGSVYHVSPCRMQGLIR